MPRLSWTMTLSAREIVWRAAASDIVNPAMPTIASMRESASRGVLAWTVVIEPSWPVFMAWSMSSTSAPRTSPTTIRSGRMRRRCARGRGP